MWVSPDHIFILEKELRDFPGGTGVRTLGFQHRGTSSIPGQVTKIPQVERYSSGWGEEREEKREGIDAQKTPVTCLKSRKQVVTLTCLGPLFDTPGCHTRKEGGKKKAKEKRPRENQRRKSSESHNSDILLHYTLSY